MNLPRLPVLACLFVLLSLLALHAPAQADDPGVKSATYLLGQTTQLYQDGRHNVMLRSLRQLSDPGLRPLYQGLATSELPPQRVHAMLGLGETSASRRLDLAALAEVKDEREVVEVLSAAMDDELIDKAGLATLLTWDGLSLPVKQAVAVRLLGEGGTVDASAFRKSLEVELSDELDASALLQYALAAVVMAEAGDPAGPGKLAGLAKLKGTTAEAVLAQLFDGSMRRGLKSVGPIALQIAAEPERDLTLRLYAIQSALRLKTKGADQLWARLYSSETEEPRRTRLMLVALDAAADVDPSLFDRAANDSSELIRLVAQAGRAIAQGRGEAPAAFAPLLATGQPLVANWLPTFCRREKPAYGADLLELVIKQHAAGEERNRGRLAEAAISAVNTLCELYPEQAAKRLPALLDQNAKPGQDNPDALQARRMILLGIARSHRADLKALAAAINTDQHNDLTTEALRLLIRARFGSTMTQAEWDRISDLVQGVGQIDPGLRIQFAWLYLKHKGQGANAIASALR